YPKMFLPYYCFSFIYFVNLFFSLISLDCSQASQSLFFGLTKTFSVFDLIALVGFIDWHFIL
ncbi:MAG: hypothetical protein LC127_04465, partial [Chitinophagales bacterium]|nr:hypothetical protein [Chitinophagales bacterium]